MMVLVLLATTVAGIKYEVMQVQGSTPCRSAIEPTNSILPQRAEIVGLLTIHGQRLGKTEGVALQFLLQATCTCLHPISRLAGRHVSTWVQSFIHGVCSKDRWAKTVLQILNGKCYNTGQQTRLCCDSLAQTINE